MDTGFSLEKESSIAPIWVRFPHLPLHLFSKASLFSIASSIGNPLKLDEPTALRNRPSVARVCVEIDLRKRQEDSVWIKNGQNWFSQKVCFENVPTYCDSCWRRSHLKTECKGKDLDFSKKQKTGPKDQGVTNGEETRTTEATKTGERPNTVSKGKEKEVIDLGTNGEGTEATLNISKVEGNGNLASTSGINIIDQKNEDQGNQTNCDKENLGEPSGSNSLSLDLIVNETLSKPSQERTNLDKSQIDSLIEAHNQFQLLQNLDNDLVINDFQLQENEILKMKKNNSTAEEDWSSSSEESHEESLGDTLTPPQKTSKSRGKPKGKKSKQKDYIAVKRNTGSNSDSSLPF